MKRSCHICEIEFDNLDLVRQHVAQYHPKKAFTCKIAILCYCEAVEHFAQNKIRYIRRGCLIPEMGQMFAYKSALAWCGLIPHDCINNVPVPTTYLEAIERAAWVDDGLDGILKVQADMIEMMDGMDEELCLLANN